MSERQAIGLFTEVDRTQDPGFFTRFLDEGNNIPDIRASKPVILDGLHLRGGETVLDAGCGMGADVIEIAQRVGPTGRVIGIDVSEVMIAEAQRRTASLGLSIEVEVGDAQQLRFPDGMFDACRTERMLEHVPDAERALTELVRVTRPGGCLAVFDFDLDTVVIDNPYRDTTRAVVRSFSDSIRHGWIGRQLPRLFQEQGLTAIQVAPRTIRIGYEFAQLLLGGHLTRAQQEGVLAPAALERWWRQLEAAEQAGTFYMAFTAFIVSGTRPSAGYQSTNARAQAAASQNS